MTLVLTCALLKDLSAAFWGASNGVIKYGFRAYPLSPRSIPSISLDSNLSLITLSLKILESCVLPGHRAAISRIIKFASPTTCTLREKNPLRFRYNSPSRMLGHIIGTCVQSIAPMIPAIRRVYYSTCIEINVYISTPR